MKICHAYPDEIDGKTVDIVERHELAEVIVYVKLHHDHMKRIKPSLFEQKPELNNMTVQDMLDDYMVIHYAWIEDDGGERIDWTNELFAEYNYIP